MLAVLVSATPCPLILAVPIAIISGISKAARRGVLVKGGPVLETLARATVLVIDKTGTLTEGRATLVSVHTSDKRRPDEILRLAASLDQASQHVIAASVVEAAIGRGLALSMPVHAKETGGGWALKGKWEGKGSSSAAAITCAGSLNFAPEEAYRSSRLSRRGCRGRWSSRRFSHSGGHSPPRCHDALAHLRKAGFTVSCSPRATSGHGQGHRRPA